MNLHQLPIRRFIIAYVTVFILTGTMLITLFAYIFGLTVIQKSYMKDYVEETFLAFDSKLEDLSRNINLVAFNISSNNRVQSAIVSSTLSEEEKAARLQRIISSFLKDIPEIYQLDIITNSGSRYSCYADLDSKDVQLSSLPTDFLSQLNDMISLKLYQSTLSEGTAGTYIVLGRNAVIGSIIVYVNERTFFELYNNEMMKNSLIMLTLNDRIISCSDSDYIGLPYAVPQKILQSASGGGMRLYQHTSYIVPLDAELSISYFISNSDYTSLIHRANIVIFILLVCVVAGCLLVAILLSGRLIRRVRLLQDDLDHFSRDHTHHFSADQNSELEDLENHFVEMSDHIRQLIDSIDKEQEEKRIAELKALQSQINPHFIYNSIDAISWMAKLEKPYSSIEQLAYHLGMFFRLGLHKGENIITVQEEIQHVKSYIEIEKIRFPGKFTVEYDVDPALTKLKVIKIILQPLVENAINHGFEGIDYPGRILIRVQETGSEADPGSQTEDGRTFVEFTVQDNGTGFEYSGNALPVNQNPSGGYALGNIQERLELEYGGDASIDFITAPGEGTTAVIRIAKDRMR